MHVRAVNELSQEMAVQMVEQELIAAVTPASQHEVPRIGRSQLLLDVLVLAAREVIEQRRNEAGETTEKRDGDTEAA
jgi:hypothetical protein